MDAGAAVPLGAGLAQRLLGRSVVGLEECGLEVGVDATGVEQLDGGADDGELRRRLVGAAEVGEQLAELGEVFGQRLPGDHVLPGLHGCVEVAARGLEAGRGDRGAGR